MLLCPVPVRTSSKLFDTYFPVQGRPKTVVREKHSDVWVMNFQ